MKGKLALVIGLGAGYLLGTRAGRERFDQIKRAADGVWKTPAVQQGFDAVKEFASAGVERLPDSVVDAAKQFVGTITRGETTTEDVEAAATKVKEAAAEASGKAKTEVKKAAKSASSAL